MSETTSLTLRGQTFSTADPLSARVAPARSLYVHIPFCFHKCHYCDFYSFVDTRDRQDAFTETLLKEIAALAGDTRRALGPSGGPPALDTIFVGGGTPTLLRVDLWERLLGALHRSFDLGPILAGDGEFTVECNPETASAELFDTLSAGGVDRLSVGAQSFDPRHLKTLERWHDPASVGRALRLAAEAGIERRSLDLIYAIPGQSLADWEADLERALALDPGVEHVSAYALTYEPNTPMTARLRRGEFDPAPDDLEVEMHEAAHERFSGAGYSRYEISNYAKRAPDEDASVSTPRAASRHNLAYWRAESWLAAGPSASGHLLVLQGDASGHRWKNVPRLSDWMAGVEASGGYSPIVEYETPDPRRGLIERVLMGIRLAEGLDAPSLLAWAGRLGCAEALAAAAREQLRDGLLETGADRWRLTDRGVLFADAVAGALIEVI